MNYDFTNLIRAKVDEYNRKMGAGGGGYAEGGMSQPGIIPGPVTPGGGDNTMTPTQTGEYIIPVDAVMGLGVQNGATSMGDALAIGKHVLDKTVSGLKKMMGNTEPPRNAGIPAEEGFAEGGMVDAGDTPDNTTTAPGLPASTVQPWKYDAGKIDSMRVPIDSSPPSVRAPEQSVAVATPSPAITAPSKGIPVQEKMPDNTFTDTGTVPAPGKNLTGAVMPEGQVIGRDTPFTAPAPAKADPIMFTPATGQAMPESEAYAQGMMTPEQKVNYEARQQKGREQDIEQSHYDALKGIAMGKQDTANRALDIKKEQGDRANDIKKIMADAKANPGAMSGLDDQTKHDLAKRYTETGQLPPLGMGAAAAKDREAILGEWSKMMHGSGGTVEDQILRQSALKASQGELNKLQGQRGVIMSFAKTANSNLELVSKLSETVGRTGVPLLNKWVLAGKRSIAGDPEVSKFDAAVRTAINEYAKVTSSATGGQVTSDAARKEVEGMLNTAQTPEQVKEVISLLRQEIGNRSAGYDSQINEIKSAISGKPVEQPGIPASSPSQPTSQGDNRISTAARRVKSDLSNGFSRQQIVDALKKAGHSPEELESIFTLYHQGV